MSNTPTGPVDSDVSPALLPLATQQPINVSATASSVSGSALLGYGTNTSPVSTSGTTFAAGADLLAADISFTADGTADYIVKFSAPQCFISVAADTVLAHLNLDGADGGVAFQAQDASPGGTSSMPFDGRAFITAPSAGAHTVNIRIRVNGGTGTVDAGAGGAGASLPIIVFVEKLV